MESLVMTFLMGSFILNIAVIMFADMLERRAAQRDPLNVMLGYIYVLLGIALVTYSCIMLLLVLILSPRGPYPSNLVYVLSSFVDKSMDLAEPRFLM